MSEVITNIRKVLAALKAGHGDFSLFELMMPEDSDGRWDLIMAAPWLGGALSDYDRAAHVMKRVLPATGMSAIGRIVILGSQSTGSQLSSVSLKMGEMRDFVFGDVRIREAHVMEINPAAARKLPVRRGRPKRARALT